MALNIVILAAGNGTRMNSKVPKVMHQLGGKPLLEHVIKTAEGLYPEKIHVIYGDSGNLVRRYFSRSNINWVEQHKKLGTGHAVMQVIPHIKHSSQVLVLYGDVPLVSIATLRRLIKSMPAGGLSLLSVELPGPEGFGRILRDRKGDIASIVEHKDATRSERQIKEINTGLLATTSKILNNYLPRLDRRNAKGEYYLTDIIEMLYDDEIPLRCLLASNPIEMVGINDQKQRAELERQYQRELVSKLMLKGLILMDPGRFDLRGDLVFGNNVMIDVNTVIEGEVKIGSNTSIGTNNFLKNVWIGGNVTIKPNCVIEDAVIADNCIVGPFARIRPGSILEKEVRVGNFVEVKNTRIGKNSKANHVGYLGDSIIGKDVNIGAGT